jgi:malate dehydrogenase
VKIAIIGAGNVGAATCQRIAEADLCDVVLVDIIKGKAEALALDLSSASSIVRHNRSIIGTDDFKEIAGVQVVVITAGLPRQSGQSRQDLLQNNAGIVKDVCGQIAQYCPQAIVIVVTNPLDVMTYLVCKTTGFSAERVIGMGGILDCARFNLLAGKELNTASYNLQSLIIGAHADSMVVLPRLATVQGTALKERLTPDRIEGIVQKTRNFGARVVRLLGNGSSFYGPSAAIFLLLETILNDRKKTLCASIYLCGQYGLEDLCIGVPAKIGRQGIEEIIELQLNPEEMSAFLESAKRIKESIKDLGV